MRSLRIVILIIWSQVLWASGGPVITVGSDGACDYNSITEAIFSAPAAGLIEVRVAKNVAISSTQLIDDRNIFIRGGFDSCTDTSASGKTQLNGTGFFGPIFVVDQSLSTSSRLSLYLQDLEFTGGNSNNDAGVFSLKGGWELSLDNVLMYDNTTNANGGAILIEDSDDSAVISPRINIFNNSILTGNTAANGGAIACDGNGFIDALDMQLSLNDANVNGGAVYLNNGCRFFLYSGQLFQGIRLNEAQGFGGGIFATNDSVIFLQSNVIGEGAAEIVSNTAANGGGIGLTNGASLVAFDAIINNNTATSTGGGIRSTGGHVLIKRVTKGALCHEEVRCSQLSGNKANGTDASFSGGGAIATFGGTLEISGTYIENNRAFYGSAIRARFMSNDFPLIDRMHVVGSVFAKNKEAPQVVFLDNSSANITFSTFVDNQDMDRVIELDHGASSTSGNEVLISGSIFEHFDDFLPAAELTSASGQLPSGDCNNIEPMSTGDLAGEPRSPSYNVIFANRALGDYRLLNDSPLIDWCDSSFMGSAANYSANGFQRPIDNPMVANVSGTYDLGGLEHYELDLIFKDDFE